jgi:hypothetical protein
MFNIKKTPEYLATGIQVILGASSLLLQRTICSEIEKARTTFTVKDRPILLRLQISAANLVP